MRHESSTVVAHASNGRAVGSDIVWFEGGVSWIGTDYPELPSDGESPRRRVRLAPFGLDRFAVSNARFCRFVAETRYVTESERLGWSYVFRGLLEGSDQGFDYARDLPWWLGIEGACWKHPEGPHSSLEGRGSHPVTHLSWNDAAAFAAWADGRLAREAEWEHAARGGAADRRYPWGDAEPTDHDIHCNIWQGSFPELNTCADGFYGTAPVDAFQPNRVGLFNMSGNVWEWCSDAFRIRSIRREARKRDRAAVADRARVLKGGSFLCHRSYCWRYRIAARTGRPSNSAASHTGMRVAYEVPTS